VRVRRGVGAEGDVMNGAGAANGRLAWSLIERDPAAA
jgi:hypothetical protein